MEQQPPDEQDLPPVVTSLMRFFDWCESHEEERVLLGREGYEDTIADILEAHGFDPQTDDAQAIAVGTRAISEDISRESATKALNEFMLHRQAGENAHAITRLAEERTIDILSRQGYSGIVATRVRYSSLLYYNGINALAGYLLAESINQEQ
jgi:hypothetical protein